MIANRRKGLVHAMIVTLFVLNLLFFAILAYLGYSGNLGSPLTIPEYFLCAIFIVLGIFLGSGKIWSSRNRAMCTNPVEALAISTRISAGFLIGSAIANFIYPLSIDGRLFYLMYAALSFFLNIVVLTTLPRAIARNIFPEKNKLNLMLVGKGPMPNCFKHYSTQLNSLGINILGYYSDHEEEGLAFPKIVNSELSEANVQAHAAVIGSDSTFAVQPQASLPFRQAQKSEWDFRSLLPFGNIQPDCILTYNYENDNESFARIVSHCNANGIRLQAYSQIRNEYSDLTEIISDTELDFQVFVDEPLANPMSQLAKRCVDIAIALPVTLTVLPVLFAIVAIMQKIQSPGPLIFKQARNGENRNQFNIYKFRSMHTDMSDNGHQFTQAKAVDPRIFKFGKLMRRTSIDEFPQFLNVLKGDMSIVGPRPHPLQLDEEMEGICPLYRSRHFAKPGITGLAQISGYRGEIIEKNHITRRIEKDVEYIGNWSLNLDFKIILVTIYHLVKPPKSAY